MNRYRVSLAVFALLSSSVAALAAPAVALSVLAGPPTQKIKVTATGFPASSALDIYFDTANLCLSVTNGAGAASCIISAPKDAQPQQHWITAILRGSATAAQKSFTVRTDMPQFHGRNARHTGVNPFENTLNTANVGDLDLLWSAPIGIDTYGSPVVSGAAVYVGSRDGKLHAFNAITGAPIAGFPVRAGSEIHGSAPAVAAGKVFIGSDDGKLYGFNAATGARLAGFPKTLGTAIRSSPAIANGNVYIGCYDGKLYAFNTTTGAAAPGFPVTTTAGASIAGSPTIAGPNVYIGTVGGNLHAFDALTGTPRFLYTRSNAIYGALAAAGTSGFFGSQDFDIHGIRLSDGADMRGFPVTIPGAFTGSPAVARNMVFVASGNSNVYAITLHGEAAWSQTLDSTASSSPMVANGVVYVQSTERLYALDASYGGMLWSTALNQYLFSSPVVANGIVYAVDLQGSLNAYSVNGLAPSARLAGGALGVKPALSALKPNLALKAGQPSLAPALEDE